MINYIGRRAWIESKYFDISHSGVYECIRQEDDNFFVFKLTESSELVVFGYDKAKRIKWLKE